VTGVFKKLSTPSHIDASFFMPFNGGGMNRMANDNPSLANNNMFYTYLLLKQPTDAQKLATKFPAFIKRHLGDELKEMGKERKYFITPIADIHSKFIKTCFRSRCKKGIGSSAKHTPLAVSRRIITSCFNSLSVCFYSVYGVVATF
jgi:hypothetical protein